VLKPGADGSSDQVVFDVADDRGAASQASVTITFPANAGPSCAGGASGRAPGRAVTIPVFCSDPDPEDRFKLRVASPPSHGTVRVGSAHLEYTPTEGYEGQDTFTFTADDGRQRAAPATVTTQAAIDQDKDGVPRPEDCDDLKPAIRPNAPEVPGNDIDENCDGIPRPRVKARITPLWPVFGNDRTVVRGLRVTLVPKGATVEVRCAGKGCAFKRKRAAAPERGRTTLTGFFKRRRLPVGTRIEVRVTAPGRVGLVRRWTTRRYPSLPKAATLCLAPGARTPKKRC